MTAPPMAHRRLPAEPQRPERVAPVTSTATTAARLRARHIPLRGHAPLVTELVTDVTSRDGPGAEGWTGSMT
jgi:hypothetical protein